MIENFWKKEWEVVGESEDIFTNLGRSNFDHGLLVKYLHDINNSLNVVKTDNILEVGCSNGLITALLSPFTNRIKGIDYSANLIKKANSIFGSVDNMSFEENDITKIEYDGYNKLLVGGVLQYLGEESSQIFFLNLIDSKIDVAFICHIPYLPKQESFLDGYKAFIKDEKALQEKVNTWKEKMSWYNDLSFELLEKYFKVTLTEPHKDLVQHKYAIDLYLERK